MKRVNRFRHSYGNINAAGNSTSATAVTIKEGSNERLQLWGLTVSMTTASDFTVEILIGGVVQFTKRVILTLSFGANEVGPPAGTYFQLEGSGAVTIRLTNNAGSASAQNEVVMAYTVRPNT